MKVIMYSTRSCSYCKSARKYFAANNIAFIDYDIEKNKRARQKFDALGGRGVPLIFVGKKRLNGFDISHFKKLYR